jgi:hypothetical protein
MSRRKFFVMYLMSILVVYAFLVIDNLVWNIYDGEFGNIVWCFTTEFTNLQDMFTIISLGLFITLVLMNRIIRDFVYPYGMAMVFLVLGINKVLWNLEIEAYQSIISIILFEQNWITMFIGAFVFLFYYDKFKKIRRRSKTF